MPDKSLTKGAHHIGLTVPDLNQTRGFFIETLGFEQIGEVPDYPAVFLTDGTTMLTLWQVQNPQTAVAFDRKNVIGLHHFALKVDDTETLGRLYDNLKAERDVEIEFAPNHSAAARLST